MKSNFSKADQRRWHKRVKFRSKKSHTPSLNSRWTNFIESPSTHQMKFHCQSIRLLQTKLGPKVWPKICTPLYPHLSLITTTKMFQHLTFYKTKRTQVNKSRNPQTKTTVRSLNSNSQLQKLSLQTLTNKSYHRRLLTKRCKDSNHNQSLESNLRSVGIKSRINQSLLSQRRRRI